MKTDKDDLDQATDEQSQAMANRQIAWPDNPRGFVVSQQQLYESYTKKWNWIDVK